MTAGRWPARRERPRRRGASRLDGGARPRPAAPGRPGFVAPLFRHDRIDQRRRRATSGRRRRSARALVVRRRRADGRPRPARPHLVFAARQRTVCLGRPRAWPRAQSIADRATTLMTLAAGVALAEADRARPPVSVSISSGRTICWCRGASSAASSPRVLAAPAARRTTVVARLRRQCAVRPRFRRSCATARRRSSRSSDAPSIALSCSPKRWRRSRSATRICSLGGSMLFSTRGERSRPAQPRRARRLDDATPEPRRGSTDGIDDSGALLVRPAIQVERIVSRQRS